MSDLSTLVWFTHPSGKDEQVLFSKDYVATGDLHVGSRLCVFPSGKTYSLLLEPSPEEEVGYACRVMSTYVALLPQQSPDDTEMRQTWCLHLALETVSTRLH